MALWVVATRHKFGCYKTIRIVNTASLEVKDYESLELLHMMRDNQHHMKIENLIVDYKRDSFKFVGCDDSRICIIDKNGQPLVNSDGLVVVDIEGEFVYVANWKGQIIKAHMLQVVNNVKRGKAVLTNADIALNGRITFKNKK